MLGFETVAEAMLALIARQHAPLPPNQSGDSKVGTPNITRSPA